MARAPAYEGMGREEASLGVSLQEPEKLGDGAEAGEREARRGGRNVGHFRPSRHDHPQLERAASRKTGSRHGLATTGYRNGRPSRTYMCLTVLGAILFIGAGTVASRLLHPDVMILPGPQLRARKACLRAARLSLFSRPSIDFRGHVTAFNARSRL
jgi:hypothetical protein